MRDYAEFKKRNQAMKHKLILSSPEIKRRAVAIVEALGLEPVHEMVIREYKTIRNLQQNAKLYAMLTDISNQVIWYGQKLSKEEWKDVFTASLKKLKVVPAIEGGGFVVVGAHTSTMSVPELAEMIEFMYAFGAQHNVVWKEPDYPEEQC